MSIPGEERHSPLGSQIALIVGFVLLVAAGVVTVLIPELSSEDEVEGQTTEAEAAATESAEPDGT